MDDVGFGSGLRLPASGTLIDVAAALGCASCDHFIRSRRPEYLHIFSDRALSRARAGGVVVAGGGLC